MVRELSFNRPSPGFVCLLAAGLLLLHLPLDWASTSVQPEVRTYLLAKAASRGVFWVSETPLKGPAEGVTSDVTVHNGASTWYQLTIMPGSKQAGRQVKLENGGALPPLVMIMGPDQAVELKTLVFPSGTTLEITADRDTVTAMGMLTIDILTTFLPVHVPLPNWLGCADMHDYVANLPTAADVGLGAAWGTLKNELTKPENIAAIAPYLAKHNTVGAVKTLAKVYKDDARAFAALSQMLKELGVAVKPTDLSSWLSSLGTVIGSGKLLGHAIGAPHDDSTLLECVSRTVTSRPAPTQLCTTTVFVIDSSGSMASNTPDGKQKLEAAKEAARHYLDIIDFDSSQLGAHHQAALVSFSDRVYSDLSPTSSISDVRSVLDGLSPLSSTNFGDPLDTAMSWFENLPADQRNGRKLIVFLSDGMTNAGPVSHDQFLVDNPDQFTHPFRLYQRARREGVRIYTVGFGEPQNVGGPFLGDAGLDESVLRKIAETPGTGGKYLPARDAFELDEVYVRSFHDATGNVVFESTGTVTQGERKPAAQIDVVPENLPTRSVASSALTEGFSFLVTPAYADTTDKGQMLVTLGWSSGKLGLELVDPSGKVVDQAYPGAHLNEGSQLLCLAVDQPKVGKWAATVVGEDVPQGGSRYHLIASARVPPRPAFGGGGATAGGGLEDQLLTAVLLAICVVLALSIAVLIRRRRDAMRAATSVARRSGPNRQVRDDRSLR